MYNFGKLVHQHKLELWINVSVRWVKIEKKSKRERGRRWEFHPEGWCGGLGGWSGCSRPCRKKANLKVRLMRKHSLTSVLCATGKLEMWADRIVRYSFPLRAPLKKKKMLPQGLGGGWRYYHVRTSDPGQHHLYTNCITRRQGSRSKEIKID